MNPLNLPVLDSSHTGLLMLSNSAKGEFLANKIKNKIKDRGLSRQEFAKLMNVQPSIITRWLSGNHNFTVETLFDIERQLNLQIIDIGYDKRNGPIYFHLTVQSSETDLRNMPELFKVLENVSPSAFENGSKSQHSLINESVQQDESYSLPDRMITLLKAHR